MSNLFIVPNRGYLNKADYETIFMKRVREQYYLPEFLLDLTNAEMLPEVFADPRVPVEEQERVLAIIDAMIKEKVRTLGWLILVAGDPLVAGRGATQLFAHEHLILKTRDWKGVCENMEDVKKYGLRY